MHRRNRKPHGGICTACQFFHRSQTSASGSRWSVVALLLAINLLNYVDRYVLAAVEPHIREDLFPDGGANVNALMGFLPTAFLLSYMIAAPIFGWLSDRMNRWWIISGGVIVWSLASGGSGLASDLCHAARHAAVHRLWRSGLWAGGPDGPGRLVSGRAARTDSLAVLRRHSGRQRARLFAGRLHGRALRLANGLLCFAAAGNPAGTRLSFPARSAPTRRSGGPAGATRGQS